jgi:signal transduction histidine kinase
MGLRLYVVLLVAAGVTPALASGGFLLAYYGGPSDNVLATVAALFLVGIGLAYAISSRIASAIETSTRSQERDKALAALRENEKRFRDFAAASSDWFWEMDPDLEFVKVLGRGGERYSQNERTRRSFHWPSQMQNEATKEILATSLHARRPFRDLFIEFRQDGRQRHIKISGVPCDDDQGAFRGYRGTGADVTVEREREAHARLVEERFMQALENINEGFAIYGADERLVACNDRYKRMHWRNGRDPSSEPVRLGMTIREIYMIRARNGLYEVPPGQGIEEFADTKLANYRAFRDHWYWQTADGRWLHISQTRTKDGGSVSLWTDLTDLKAAEVERRKLEEQLQHSQKLESLGTLAGGVAHDLNNILVPIMALTKITAAHLPEASKDRRNLLRVLQASERARDLVRQILAFSRKDESTKQTFDLEEIVQEALRMLRASIPATIRLAEQIEPVAPLYGDPAQLHQIIVNLVTNAAHAIGESTGVVTVGLRSAPAAEGEVEHVVLTVRDTGSGMEEATQARIFDPFFTTKPVGEGSGLGLSIVHGIVVAHGGRIDVSSRSGEGSEFRVTLPRAGRDAAAPTMLLPSSPGYFSGPAWGQILTLRN